MSLEAKIDELNATVSKLIGVLQLANANAGPTTHLTKEAPAQTSATTTAPTQTRGRPTNAAKAAAEAATKAAEEAKTAAEAPADDDGGFLDEEPVAPAVEYTTDQVRAALVGYQKAVNSQEKARKLLKDFGGVETLAALPKDKYGAVITAANKR